MTDYLLHLRDATKQSTGVYRWSFSHHNQDRPRGNIRIGPVNITCPSEKKEVVLRSKTFARRAKGHILRGDNLHDVVYVCHPETRYISSSTSTSTSSTEAASGGASDVEAIHAANDLILWLTMESSTTLSAGYLPITTLDTSDIKFVTNRTTGAPSSIFLQAYQYLSRTTFGQSHCVYGYNHSWNSFADSQVNPPWDMTRPWVVHQMWRAPATLAPSYFYELSKQHGELHQRWPGHGI